MPGSCDTQSQFEAEHWRSRLDVLCCQWGSVSAKDKTTDSRHKCICFSLSILVLFLKALKAGAENEEIYSNYETGFTEACLTLPILSRTQSVSTWSPFATDYSPPALDPNKECLVPSISLRFCSIWRDCCHSQGYSWLSEGLNIVLIMLPALKSWPRGVDIPKSPECWSAQPLAFVGNRCSLWQGIPPR